MSTAEQSQQPKQPSGTPANHPTTSSLSHKLLLHLGTTLVHLLFGLVLVPLLTLFIPFIVSPLIYYYSLLLDALQILPPALVAWLAKLGVAPSREWLLVFAKGVNKVAMVLLVPWGLFWVAGVSHALLGVRGRGDGVGSTAPKDEPSKLALAGMLLGALPIVLNWWARSRSDQALELPSSLAYLSAFYLVLIMAVIGRLTLAAMGASPNPLPHPKSD